jgi:hypothetical protein
MPRLLKIRVERICDCLDRETRKFRAGEQKGYPKRFGEYFDHFAFAYHAFSLLSAVTLPVGLIRLEIRLREALDDSRLYCQRSRPRIDNHNENQ